MSIAPIRPDKADLLRAGFAKWNRDFRFLLDRFRAVLDSGGEPALAALVEEAFSGNKPDGPLPPRGAQALSIAFQLLNTAEENTSNQVRRARETAHGPESETGLWPDSLQALKKAGFAEKEIRKHLGRIHVQPVLTAHPTEAKRATVLEHHRELYQLALQWENIHWTPMEQEALSRRIETAVERLWRTG